MMVSPWGLSTSARQGLFFFMAIFARDGVARVTLDDLYGEEAAEWMRLSPRQRWAETIRLAAWYDALGGTSDPDPD
ncbi:MAG TPA: hypothetical protein VHV78_09820, partial [Gemmatimonadaceae bacterium]|nr:hypothetical protein [Gemmatimonadaceae bacterium]